MATGRLNVRVTPRASANRVDSRGGRLRVWVTAPPAESRANAAVAAALGKALNVPRTRLSIERGQKSRDKTVVISGITQAELDRLLEALE